MPKSNSHITPGSLWVCQMKMFDSSPDDIYAKVLKVGEEKVFVERKTNYGFKDLPPMSIRIYDFLDTFKYVGEYKS